MIIIAITGFLLPGEDKNVYSYDKTGSVVKGWKPFRTAGHVKGEVSYFKVSGKDYIVVSDDNSLYFLDRTGNIRVNLKEIVKKAEGSASEIKSRIGSICFMHFN